MCICEPVCVCVCVRVSAGLHVWVHGCEPVCMCDCVHVTVLVCRLRSRRPGPLSWRHLTHPVASCGTPPPPLRRRSWARAPGGIPSCLPLEPLRGTGEVPKAKEAAGVAFPHPDAPSHRSAPCPTPQGRGLPRLSLLTSGTLAVLGCLAPLQVLAQLLGRIGPRGFPGNPGGGPTSSALLQRPRAAPRPSPGLGGEQGPVLAATLA